jgi:hypothetical protein
MNVILTFFTALFLSFLFTGLTLFVIACQPDFLPGLVILLMSKALWIFPFPVWKIPPRTSSWLYSVSISGSRKPLSWMPP